MGGEGDQPAARGTQREIAIRVAVVRRLRQVEEADSRIVESGDDIRRRIRATIRNHQQFEIRLGLREDRADREAQDVGPVMRRQQDGKAGRHPGQPPWVPGGKL